jgi:hypothetical protein
MAIFNEILSGRYNRALQKLFAIKGSPPVRQVGGEIVPVMTMGYGVENRFVELWNRYAAGVAVGPVAAQVCNFRFRNPLGSNCIAVLEKIIWTPNQNDSLSWGRNLSGGVTLPTTDLTVAISGIAIDLRQLIPGLTPGPSNSVIRFSRDTGSSANNFTYGFAQALANTTYELIIEEQHELPLSPGDVFQLDTGVVNGKSFLSAIWRERALEESELK